MAKSQARSKKKVSGTRFINFRKKKEFELGRDPTFTKVGEKKIKPIRIMSGDKKLITLSNDEVNVQNPKTKKNQKVKIDNVVENAANRHFVRRKILTKGTVIETKLGKARITSRPGQEGSLNAILIAEKS